MLAKFSISAILVACWLCNLAMGQTVPAQQTAASGLTTVGAVYSFGSQEEDEAKKKIAMLEARLKELEIDVANKLKTESSSAEIPSNESDWTQRLSKFELGLAAQEESIDKLEAAAPGYVVHGHKTPKIKLFGRIHTDYWAFPNVDESLFPLEAGGNPQDRFNFRRMRLGVSGDLNDNMLYKFEWEFAGGVATSYRDAFIGFKDLPLFRTVLIGNQKRPYGLDHLNSSRYNIFIERPFIIEAINQDARRMGISSNGYSDDLGWNWRFGVWNQELTQNKSGYKGDHYQPEFASRLARTAWYDEASDGRGYIHLAASTSFGVPDGNSPTNNQARYRTRPEARTDSRWLNTDRIDGANRNSVFGLESVVNVGAFSWTSEYLQTKVERRPAFGPNVTFKGLYTQVAYVLTREHHPWDRKTGTLGRLKPFENFFMVRDCDGCRQKGIGAWEVAFRYSHADLNDDNIKGGDADSYTFGMNWYWNSHARMQFNYILGDIHSGAQGKGEGNYQIAGVRLMVDF